MAEGRFDTARPGGNRAAKMPKGQPYAGFNMQFCFLPALFLAEMANVLPRPFQCVFDRLRLHWGRDRLGPPAGRL